MSTTRAAFDADAREQLGDIAQEMRQEAVQAKARAARAPKVRRIQIAIVAAAAVVVGGGVAGLVWWFW
jgi:ferric-dicitrate binding protein FerR (iron transport regulator)